MVLRSLLSWPIAWLTAVALLMLGFPGGAFLDHSWLRLTTSWAWTSSAPAPRFTLDPAHVPENALVVWPSGQNLSPISGPLLPPEEMLPEGWPDWAIPVALATLPEATATAAATANDVFWQPARYGYKSLVYRSGDSLLQDALLTLGRDSDWRYQPGIQLEGADQTLPVNWQGALLLADFAVPDPVFEPLKAAPVPKLAQRSEPALQAIREQWAVQQGYFVVTPAWLGLLAALVMVLPWLLPRYLARPLWAGPIVVVLWLGLNLTLVVVLRWWLPLWFPLASWLLAMTWHRRLQRNEMRHERLLTEHQTLALNWLRHLLDEGKTEAGQRFLDASSALVIDPELTYELGLGFEKKRQYDQALACYQRLDQLSPGYRDIERRLAQLGTLSDPSQTVVLGGGNSTTRTIATAAGVQAPEIGRYRILGELGRGAMGVVYDAEDPRIDRRVALKVVQLDALAMEEADSVKQRFFREAQAAGRLNHPNIVTVYDVGEERDLAYIAMDRLTGQALSDRLERKPVPSFITLCNWMAQAADALDFAHRNDIIHRDIKPANLYIDQADSRLTVTDFGVARMTGMHQTQTGVVLGSPSYMSPEQIRGESLTGATDIFSLGVTLYRALCGQLPFNGDTLPGLAFAITQTQQESPRKHNPEVPVALVRIVNKALKKNPAERYATAGEMAQALRKWADAAD
ncbi:serine/threonine-protein kinase [Saccharospirillum mangrovi]|uniref:serine/threonine-protein kinase n=1 Tax=Saccharospirillum mangrovi TaxID=2161747 RepID=UPI0013002C49|nr:serine/threonine-protein kinase [Saccharospirillum mangrovi]